MYNTTKEAMVSATTLQDTTVNTVQMTTDYAKFNRHTGNRQLNELHLERLMQSIAKENLLYANPVLVNNVFEIIDGQHRTEACKRLQLPVYYMMCNDLALTDIHTLNANSKNWKMEDYVDGYCSMRMPEYCYFKSELHRTGLQLTVLLGMLHDLNGNAGHNLKTGSLKLPHKKRGAVIYEWILDWEQYYEGARRRSFVFALVFLYNVKGYNHEQMMKKIKYQSTKVVDCVTTKSYMALLEEIYNYKERGNKLRFI